MRLRSCLCGGGSLQIEGPIQSYYWWDSAIESDREFRVVLKTRRSLFAALERVANLTLRHPPLHRRRAASFLARMRYHASPSRTGEAQECVQAVRSYHPYEMPQLIGTQCHVTPSIHTAQPTSRRKQAACEHTQIRTGALGYRCRVAHMCMRMYTCTCACRHACLHTCLYICLYSVHGFYEHSALPCSLHP